MTITIGPETPVEINQLTQEFEQAIELYQQARPMRVLEIGTAAGGTLYHWLQHAPVGATVVSVDLDMSQITQAVADTWVTDHATRCFLICGDSTTPWTQAAIRRHGPYDWLFIDGCHEYIPARVDFETYTQMCNPGALVLLHDIALQRDYGNGRTAGVHQLWRELQADGYWTRELRAAPNLTEYGIGVIKL
jgi:predicted O-methyltransferase YrrM